MYLDVRLADAHTEQKHQIEFWFIKPNDIYQLCRNTGRPTLPCRYQANWISLVSFSIDYVRTIHPKITLLSTELSSAFTANTVSWGSNKGRQPICHPQDSSWDVPRDETLSISTSALATAAVLPFLFYSALNSHFRLSTSRGR